MDILSEITYQLDVSHAEAGDTLHALCASLPAAIAKWTPCFYGN